MTQILHCTVNVHENVSRRASLADSRASRTHTRHALQVDGQRMREMFEQAPGFMTVLRGPDHVFDLANNAYYQLVGHREIIGKPVREALPELAGQGFYELLDQVYATGEPFIGRAMPIQFQSRPGAALETKHIDFVYQAMVDDDGAVTGLFVQGHDVSEAHALAQQVSYQATHDTLTGLGNRRKFEQELEVAVHHSSEEPTGYALLYLDLDQFKVVNDTCGHAAGDELLRRVAKAMREELGNHGTLARLGGDEFALLLEGCSLECGRQWAEALRQCVADIDFVWGSRRFGGSISVGVVAFGGERISTEEILGTADSACFLAKEKGRNRVHVHSADDDELTSRLREMDWVSRLRQAMDEQRLVLYAQEIAPLQDDAQPLARQEILVRLLDTDGAMVPPMAFIPAAERYSVMPTIDRYVVRAAFRHYMALDADQRKSRYYSINLSGTTLNDDTFVSFIEQEVADQGIPARRFCFEITETAAIANLTRTASVVHALREIGFRFALDDFGSGMSSFSYLKHLPVDFIKIDGEFIRNILNDEVDRAVVRSITDVAHTMGIRTVAEFVDNDTVAALLRDLGVDFAQGFGIHKPEPIERSTRGT
ncbi:EAL domain-containing protein [Aquisalimonas lutea]|uniref:putative bifunctional diguanylate cyclase/phosphodiesterase n=1 Tax=Aquisalimonas lutea TaxID=1327750 RepID=UPI0025B5ACDD|nr:EAL domain-containing protein [Aquisalimonas lutea]MDN3519701.1 EAL domain-containing protein [Aquisalimonas lutea]